jgi:hypothetical protein
MPMPRYPGTKHSGKQISRAPLRDASSIACRARVTDSSGVAGKRMLARAIRNGSTKASPGIFRICVRGSGRHDPTARFGPQ